MAKPRSRVLKCALLDSINMGKKHAKGKLKFKETAELL